MRSATRSSTLIALLVLAPALGTLSAQGNTSPPPADTAGAEEGSGFEMRIGGIYVQGDRNTYFAGKTTPGTGTMTGGEGLLRGSGAGLFVRYFEGTFAGQ